MPTFVKTGYWEKSIKSIKGWLNLDMIIEEKVKEVKISSLTTSERNAIITPKEGLTVYDSTLKVLMYFDGINWISL